MNKSVSVFISGIFTKLVTAVGNRKAPLTVEDPKYEAGDVSLGLIQNRNYDQKNPVNNDRKHHNRYPEPSGGY